MAILKQIDINTLFLVQPVRKKDIATIAVIKILNMFGGKWELHTNPTARNIPTQQFWRKLLNGYTGGDFEEFIGKTPDGDEKIIFRFNSKQTSDQ